MEVQTPARDHATFLLRLFTDGIRPDPRRTVAEWAEARRIVTEGAYEGPWRNSRAPYLVEPMERATLTHPCRRVTIKGSAQVGKTQIGVNLLGQILEETPAKALVVLPSIDSARMYNRDKLDPMIRASPGLIEAVAELVSHSGTGSTTAVKRGNRESQIEIVTGSSSKNLQSRSCRVILLEEVSEYPRDVDGRGDPVDLAIARTIAWRAVGEKVVDISTPGIKGACRVTGFYEQGSQGVWHFTCPHCEHEQPFDAGNLNWPEGQPEQAAYACSDCGGIIGERQRRALNAGGRWVHAHPERENSHSSYNIVSLFSLMTPWAEFARAQDAATGDPTKMKAFSQQWLGEAWDEQFDLPKADVLLLRRDNWPVGRVPPGVLFLIGATDVQLNRLVWAVWGFDRHFGQWLIETGTLPGDPTRPEVWREHDALLLKSWDDAWGNPRRPESWGIDSGFLSGHVYSYSRRHAGDRAPRVRSLDGKAGWKLPPLGSPNYRDVDFNGLKMNQVPIWPVGTWDMKSELAGALRLTEQGAGPDGWPKGAIRYNSQVDRAWVDEMLAEYCAVNLRTGERFWDKIRARNEAWDLAVYARAQAHHHIIGYTESRWDGLAAMCEGPAEEMLPDMRGFGLVEPAVKPPPPMPPPQPKHPPAPPKGRPKWLQPRSNWL